MKKPDDEDSILTNDLAPSGKFREESPDASGLFGHLPIGTFLKMREYKCHPATEIVPLMTHDQFQSLLKNVAKHGIIEP